MAKEVEREVEREGKVGEGKEGGEAKGDKFLQVPSYHNSCNVNFNMNIFLLYHLVMCYITIFCYFYSSW